MEDKLTFFQDKLNKAKSAYKNVLYEITDNFNAYNGSRKITNPKTGKEVSGATNVRRISYELVESQIDSNIPQPKVTARDSQNKEKAKSIESFIKNELNRLPFEKMNDEQERTCPIAGGSIFFVEWDTSKKTHSTVGELKVSLLDPKQVIPEANVNNLYDMNYLFINLLQSKQEIKEKYGVEVTDTTQEDGKNANNEDLVTHNLCFYRKDGNIGLYSFVGQQEIQDLPDYFKRKRKVCAKCGEPKPVDGDVCPKCGSKKFRLENSDTEKYTIRVPTSQTNNITGELETVMSEQEIEVPYYSLNQFPIVIRPNVSKIDSFLGSSDVEVIKDQERDVNIEGTKIREKLLKGGSILFKKGNFAYTPNDEELQVVKADKPSDSLQVLNMQPNIQYDMQYKQEEYETARQTLGITDSFQGRKDPTATSGKAKEFATAQTAGRLQSKRIMKNTAYADLFELMFKFYLAYADEPRTYVTQDANGDDKYMTFNRHDFIEQDEAGQYYYNDRYLFSTDSAANLSTNREAMWQETRNNYTSGTMGNPQDIQTQISFWTIMSNLDYPTAKTILEMLKNRQNTMMSQMQQQLSTQQQQITQLITESQKAQQINQIQQQGIMSE